MILTNAKMLDSIPVLVQAKEEKGLLGYAVAVNLRKLTAETEEYAKKRDALLAEYGTDNGGGKYGFTPETAAAFYAALQPYAELTADVPVMQVAPEVLYGGNLTSEQMYALSWMVKED